MKGTYQWHRQFRNLPCANCVASSSFKGLWQPKKDASNSEGWQLQFIGEQKDAEGPIHNIKLDILPREVKVAQGSTEANQPRICQIYRFMCVCCKH